MVIIRLWGGIGNQLFQYAFGEYLREKYQITVQYDIDSFGNSDLLRKFELSILDSNIPINFSTHFSKFLGIKNRIMRFFYTLRNNFIEEDEFSEKCLFKYLKSGDVYLQGYWQNAVYANVLIKKKKYIPKGGYPKELAVLFDKIEKSQNTVALHIRRGDYFLPKNINVFGVCDANYYREAINFISGKEDSISIFVFSDDLDWVKENVELPVNTIFIPNYNISQYWYIYMMSLCKHNIISNSSFSWWGAFLNMNVNKIVISPSKWTLNSDKTIALDEWIKI